MRSLTLTLSQGERGRATAPSRLVVRNAPSPNVGDPEWRRRDSRAPAFRKDAR